MPTNFIRNDQYHPDKHHFSNWCRKCGLYYCWHPESPASTDVKYYRHLTDHIFRPMTSEYDYPDWGDVIFYPRMVI